MQIFKRVWPRAIFSLFILLVVSCTSAPTREEAMISDLKVDATLAHLQQTVKGANNLMHTAKGILVFPGVLEGAFWGGAEYGGDGALRIGGKTVDYYNLVALSFGAQFGVQKKDVIFLFMDSNALQDFRKSPGWRVGLDGKVTLVSVGA
jgi:lipid-binding SYLF domain-containing protein